MKRRQLMLAAPACLAAPWAAVRAQALPSAPATAAVPAAPAVPAVPDLPALIERSRRAVVAVGTFSALDSPRFGFRGTGFAVGDGRLVATCAHVLPEVAGTERRLTVQARGANGVPQLRGAEVLRLDRARDLALLRIDGEPLPVLALSRQGLPREGTDVAVMGFPLGTVLGLSMVTHKGIIASVTQVGLPAPTAGSLSERAVQQLRMGPTDFLQLDLTAYPGNSGGPLLDIATGEVLGVLNMVALKGTRESALTAPTGISYAVPVGYLLPLMADPR